MPDAESIALSLDELRAVVSAVEERQHRRQHRR
jgi:hypothetical protein